MVFLWLPVAGVVPDAAHAVGGGIDSATRRFLGGEEAKLYSSGTTEGASEVAGFADAFERGGRNAPTLRWAGKARRIIRKMVRLNSVPAEGDKGFIVSRAIIDQSAEALDRAPHD